MTDNTTDKTGLESLLGRTVTRAELTKHGALYDMWKDGTAVYKIGDDLYVCQPDKKVRYEVVLRMNRKDYLKEGSGI